VNELCQQLVQLALCPLSVLPTVEKKNILHHTVWITEYSVVDFAVVHLVLLLSELSTELVSLV
jgi:hypothetical protein